MLVAVMPRWKTKILLAKLNEGCLLCQGVPGDLLSWPAACKLRVPGTLFNRHINSVELPMLLVPFSPSWLKLAVLVNGIRSSALETRTVPFVPITSTVWASSSCHRGWLGWRGGEVPILHPKQELQRMTFSSHNCSNSIPILKIWEKNTTSLSNLFFFFLLLSSGYGLWLLVMY